MDWLASHPLLGLIVAAVSFVVLLVGGSWVRRMERTDTDRDRTRDQHDDPQPEPDSPRRPSRDLIAHGPVHEAQSGKTSSAAERTTHKRRRKGKTRG